MSCGAAQLVTGAKSAILDCVVVIYYVRHYCNTALFVFVCLTFHCCLLFVVASASVKAYVEMISVSF